LSALNRIKTGKQANAIEVDADFNKKKPLAPEIGKNDFQKVRCTVPQYKAISCKRLLVLFDSSLPLWEG
jgi:hypothetical protein